MCRRKIVFRWILGFFCLFVFSPVFAESGLPEKLNQVPIGQKEPFNQPDAAAQKNVELFEYQAIKVPVEQIWYEEIKNNFVALRTQTSSKQSYFIHKENRYFAYSQSSSVQPQLLGMYGIPTSLGIFGLGASVSYLSVMGENTDLIQNMLVQIPLEGMVHYNFLNANWNVLSPWFEAGLLGNLLVQQSNLSKNQLLTMSRHVRTSMGLQFNLNYIPYWLGLSDQPIKQMQNLQLQVAYQRLWSPWGSSDNNVLFMNNGLVVGLALYYF